MQEKEIPGKNLREYVIIGDMQFKKTEQLEELFAKLKKAAQDNPDIQRIFFTGDYIYSKVWTDAQNAWEKMPEEERKKFAEDPSAKPFIEIARAKFSGEKMLFVAWLRKFSSEKKAEHLQSLKEGYKDLFKRLKDIGIDFKMIGGNVDISEKAEVEAINEVLEELDLTSHFLFEPTIEEIEPKEVAIVYWPYQHPRVFQDQEKWRQKIEELREKIGEYNLVLVIGHEHILKGYKEEIYKKKVLEKLGKSAQMRTPRSEGTPSYKYIWHMLSGLNERARAVYIFGHLHVGEEELTAGLDYLSKEEAGAMPFSVKIAPPDRPVKKGEKWKTVPVDFLYLPEAGIKRLQLKKEGAKWGIKAELIVKE